MEPEPFVVADYKAASIMTMKQLFKGAVRGTEARFLAALTAEEKNLYQTALPISWVPIEGAARLFEKGVAVLYPGDPKGLERLGRENALNDLKGVYKIFVKIATVPFLMSQTARLWRNYYKKGEARTTGDPDRKTGVMIVEQFPDLPAALRKIIAGYLAGAVELTGARKVGVACDESDSRSWSWKVTWE